MKDRSVIVTSEILSLNAEAHPDYMEIEVGIISNKRNLNNTLFTDEFIDTYAETIIGMPIQVDREQIEKGNYDSLTHKYQDGELLTDSIGQWTEVYASETEDGAKLLVGKARIWRRYPKTCVAIEELHEDGALAVSVEAILTNYEDSTNGERDAYEGRLIGATIVSNPAEVRATSILLVAEALAEDIAEGGNDLDVTVAEMSMEDKMYAIQEALWSADLGWNVKTFDDMVIFAKYEEDKYKYYAMSYTMSEDGKVELDMESMMEYAVAYVPVEDMEESFIQAEITVADKLDEIKTLSEQIEELKVELENAKEEEVVAEEEPVKDEAVEENADNSELDSKLDELSEKVIALKEQLDAMKEENTELKEKAEELDAIKAQEKAEQEEAEKARLVEKASRYFEQDEEGNFEESVANAIAELDEKALKLLIADKVDAEYVVAEVEEDEEEFEISSAEEKIKIDPFKDFVDVKIK